MKPRRKQLEQYVGILTPRQAAEGIAAAADTARALLEDAELLLEHRRWPRAAAIATLAIEEANKSRMIHGVLLADSEKIRLEAWRAYRSHTKKNLTYILPVLARDGARKLEDLRALYDPKRRHAEALDKLKQLAVYSEAKGVERCSWSTPSGHVNEGVARAVVFVARILVRAAKDVEEQCNEAALELYIRHVKTAGKESIMDFKQAAMNYYIEGERTGVLRAGAAQEAAEFLGMLDYLKQARA